jgi:hypothetical protein
VTSDNGCVGFESSGLTPVVVNKEDVPDILLKLQFSIKPISKLQ